MQKLRRQGLLRSWSYLFVFCTRDRSEYKYYALLASFMVGSSALLVSAFQVLSVSFYPSSSISNVIYKIK